MLKERWHALQHAAEIGCMDGVDFFTPDALLEFANDLRRPHAAQPSDTLASRIMWLE